MAITSDDILVKYREEMNNFLSIIEPKIDESILENYASIITRGHILITGYFLAQAWNNTNKLPEHIKISLVVELNKIYVDWKVEAINDHHYYLFTPPADLIDKLKNSKVSKKENKVEDKIEEVNDRAEILDL